MLEAKSFVSAVFLCCAGLTLSADHAPDQDRSLALTIGPSVTREAASGTAAFPRPKYRHLTLSGQNVAWRSAAAKVPTKLTYAVLTSDLSTKGAINCASMKPPAFALAPSHVSDNDFRHELRAAFALWSEAANIDFVETDDEANADILFGAEATAVGHAFTNVTPAAPGSANISKALVCLSPGSRWKLGFDGNLDVYDLRYTLAHEIGHAIGLDHPSRSGHLMSYRYVESRRGLSDGDREGAIALYGARKP